MKDNCVLMAESVTEGHPDKLCDTIADAVLDACLALDRSAHVACEVMATAGKIIAAGEITASRFPDIPAVLCQTVREAGYGDLIYETVNANSLSAFVKEQICENADAVPAWLDGLVNVFEKSTVSLRKAAK